MNVNAMNATDLHARLQRLDGYLLQDPDNERLLLDAFETARLVQDWPRAAAYVQRALLDRPQPIWRLRAGEVSLAQLNWKDAEVMLDAVRHDATASQAVSLAAEHQLAELMLHTGRPDQGLALLSGQLETAGGDAEVAPATQVLWLRLLHRVSRLQDAVDTAHRWEDLGLLSPPAAGVASLAALDLDLADSAERWADQALQTGHRQFEALIARASTALGHTDPATAHTLLAEALRLNTGDGRSWAMLAFADLLSEQIDQSVAHFETALKYMPEHVGTWHGLGWALILQRELTRARKVFEHALEMDRNFAESHGGLAVVLALSGERAAATAAAETARRLDRTSVTARYAEAVLAGEHEDLGRLRKMAALALAGRGAMADKAAQRFNG